MDSLMSLYFPPHVILVAHSSMAMEKEEEAKFKILMFPWLAHGHISPYVELSKKLSTTKHFDLYICSTSVNLDSIRPTLAKHNSNEDNSIKLVELIMPPSPDLPPEMHTTKNVPSNLLPLLIQAFQESSSSFTEIMDSLKPNLLLYDLFQPWAPKIASSKGIPCVYFTPTSAVPFSFFHHVYSTGTADTFPFQAVNIPGIYETAIKSRKHIQAFLKDADDDFAFGNFTRSTDIVLVKSCREIEGKYMDHLSVLCNKKVVCAGPLMAEKIDGDEPSEIMKWLSGKDRSSTVYVSFGSECFLSKDQIAEIAKGLLLCDHVNFIWAIRFPVGAEKAAEEELPAGFLGEVGERGVVVEWAPQTKILEHPSVGAFVSHSGWNSIMESIHFGVPIVAVPMQYEQPINARVAVEAGAGVEVEKGGNGCYAGEDLAGAIKKVMVSEEMRERAKLLSGKIRESEEKEVNDAAEQLLGICWKNM